MSILNVILEAAARLSDVTDEELNAWRKQARQETGDDDVRLIRERQLASWTGSSTPITQQITNSEAHIEKLLKAAMPDIRKLLPRLFAIEQKQFRIDKLKEQHSAQRAASLTNAAGELHEDYVTLARLLHRLGAGPSKVRQWEVEDLVVVADLARWKAADPRYEDGDNPWIAIRTIYAGRTMERVGKNDKAGAMSVPGPPPPDRPEAWGTKYWRFGGTAPVQQVIQQPAAPPASPTVAPDPIVLPIPLQDPAPTDVAAAATPTATAPVDIDVRADHMLSRAVAAASLVAGKARLAATGERWHRSEIERAAPGIVDEVPQQPTDKDTGAPVRNSGGVGDGSGDAEADRDAPTPPAAPPTPRPRRTLDADQAQAIAPRYVELERSWIDAFWPKGMPIDEQRREILLPAIETEFGNYRNAEPFATWFRAVEAGQVSTFIDARRDREIANVVKMLMQGHPTIIRRAVDFGLLDALPSGSPASG